MENIGLGRAILGSVLPYEVTYTQKPDNVNILVESPLAEVKAYAKALR